MCFIFQFLLFIIIMSDYLLEQITTNNFNTSISFNHPIKNILFSLNMMLSKDEKEHYKIQHQINSLCDEFNKLYIPLTYNEYISKLSPEEKYRLEYIDTIEEQMKIKLLNLEYI